MKVQVLALAVIVLASTGAALAQDDAVKMELVKMQGDWQLVRAEENGQSASERFLENLRCVIKGDRLTFSAVVPPTPLTDQCSRLAIKIDASTTPKCIDLKVEAGSLKGTVLEGVYEWKGDGLKLCLFLTDGTRNRPLDFEAKAGSNRVLFVLKRQKP
jgi:uncharacterized protein (TIGR03067 family)